MNKRIRELAEQVYGSQATEQEIKFAELIVQECISALEEKIYRSIDGEGDEVWADLILKEHFGVE